MFFRFLYIFIIVLFFSEIAYTQGDGSIFRTVVLDPGHGGRDPGALGSRVREKDIVLDIALRLGKMINETYPNVEVVYTRDSDVFVELHRRAEIANKAHANLFISIHVNAAPGRCPAGTETFVMGNSRLGANLEVARRENEAILLEEDYSIRYAGFDPANPESLIMSGFYQHAYLEQSIDFASLVQAQFKTARRGDRGVKQAPFAVLWQTAMPSILIELGFICNLEEERYMSSEAGKQQLTDAIFRAFSSYKSQFDARSHFRNSDAPTPTPSPTPPQSAPATVTPATPAVAPETTPADTPATTSTPKVEFGIQISSSSAPVELTPRNFNNYTDVERFEFSQNSYRYIVGRTSDYALIREKLITVRADFDGAFLVSIIDDRIAPLSEGLRLIGSRE